MYRGNEFLYLEDFAEKPYARSEQGMWEEEINEDMEDPCRMCASTRVFFLTTITGWGKGTSSKAGLKENLHSVPLCQACNPSPANPWQQSAQWVGSFWMLRRKISWILSLEGRRSRNKVSVGEPAKGSFTLVQFGSREF